MRISRSLPSGLYGTATSEACSKRSFFWWIGFPSKRSCRFAHSGILAVAQVILNRVRSPLFPETICGVVYQGQRRKGCQFSFTCDGHTDNPRDNAQWELAQRLSKEIMAGEQWLPEVGYSTFYHANYVSPRWARRMNKIDRIGRHIFYKKRNEEPYLVEASVEPEDGSEADEDAGYLLPTLSLATAVNTIAGSSPAAPNQAMSLGYGPSE